MTKYFVIISSTLYVNHSSDWCLFNGSYKTWYTKTNPQLAMMLWYRIYPCCSPLSLVISNEQSFRKLFLPWLSCRSWQDKPSTSRYQATCGTQNSNSRKRREISSHEKRFKQKSFKMIWTNTRKNVNTHTRHFYISCYPKLINLGNLKCLTVRRWCLATDSYKISKETFLNVSWVINNWWHSKY